LCLTSFLWHVFEVHSCCPQITFFILSCLNNLPHPFVYSFITMGHQSCFHSTRSLVWDFGFYHFLNGTHSMVSVILVSTPL
jgi:hypothetical protein